MSEGAAGHRKRLRARFAQGGIGALADYEVLELLLSYAIPRKDTKPLAKRLLARFGGLAGVVDATDRELLDVPGMGPETVLFLRFVRAFLQRYLDSRLQGRELVRTPELVRAHLRLLLQGRRTECFGVIFADRGLRALATEVLFEGDLGRAAVYPRLIMRRALELDAASLVLFHNHPGGAKVPSEADVRITQAVIEAAKALEMRVLDHFLVVDDEALSFREQGWPPFGGCMPPRS